MEGLPIEESKAADGEEAVEGDVDGKRKGVPFNRSSKKHKRLMEATPEERAAQRLSAQKAPALALSHLRTHGADALVIVLEAHPLALLLQTIRLLKPSSPFVVFSTQVLSECM